MIPAIRKAFGFWLAMWLIVPAIALMAFASIFVLIARGLNCIVVRYDAAVKRALIGLDDWVKYGREPME